MFRIAEIGIRVDNLARATEFYQTVLGFNFHHREADVVFLEVAALDSPLGDVGHPQLLALFSRGQPVDVSVSTLDHIAFEVPKAKFDAVRSRFEELGMIISERWWPDNLPWNGRSFFFRDPEGNVMEIISANQD